MSTGTPEVTIRGMPGEILLYLFGRKAQAQVERIGDDDAIAAVSNASLGF